jgi:hypothetical protein
MFDGISFCNNYKKNFKKNSFENFVLKKLCVVHIKIKSKYSLQIYMFK